VVNVKLRTIPVRKKMSLIDFHGLKEELTKSRPSPAIDVIASVNNRDLWTSDNRKLDYLI
jgi:hypothetical protein